MPFNFYEASTAPMKNGLTSLTAVLKKGEAYAAEKSIPEADVLAWTLAEDMLPLSFQVHIVCDVAMKLVARVQGEEPLQWAHTDIKTFADCHARIAVADGWLAKADKEIFEKRVDDIVKLPLGPVTKEVPAQGWFALYGLPNVFFHLTTAYAILRHKGVALGKRDFITPFAAGWIDFDGLP